MRTRQLVCTERGTVELLEMDVRDPGPQELLVRTRCTLISVGTERAFMMGVENTPERYPDYHWGYSNIGEVVAVGDGTEGFAEGDLVASNGVHADWVVCSTQRTLHVPEGLPPQRAIFFHLATIALQGVRKAAIELGERVSVMGQGTIGNLAMQQAKLSGGLPVTAIDLLDHRLEVALACGADAVANPSTTDLSELPRASVVIEATGSPDAINTAFRLARSMGRVILLASTRGNPEVNFYRDVHKAGLIIHGASNGARPQLESAARYWTWLDDCDTVLRLLAAERLVVDPMVSHRVAPEEALELYEQMKEGSEELLAPIIVWE